MANKFDWLASDSAPKNYPMEIVKGDFYYPEGGSLYIPNGKTLSHGWGDSVSTHVVGPDLKPLPNRFEITFFSYTENQFYHGSFDLPYDKIFNMFNQPYYSHKDNKDVSYRRIVAGIAPGGLVTIWVSSVDRTKEVFSGTAAKVDLDWGNIIDNPDISREEFIRDEIEESLSGEALSLLKTNGVPIDLWKSYRKRYNWQPLFSGQESPEIIDYIRYFNGERDFLELPLKEVYSSELHAVPKEMNFVWNWTGRPLLFEVFFNEEEIRNAFAELEKKANPIYLEFRAKDSGKGRVLDILLRNEEKHFFLNKTRLETYRVPE